MIYNDNLKSGKYDSVYTHVDHDFTCKCGKSYSVNIRHLPKFCPDCGKNLDRTAIQIRDAIAEARNADRKINDERDKQFVADLFEYHEVTGNPKAQQAYSIAYSHGHSSGFSEVANCFSDIVDLIK